MRCSEVRTLTFFLPAHHAQERHITPSSTDAAMILTATNQRCCNGLFDLHLSDVSCCFEVGKHPLGVLAASGGDESTSGAICITLRAAHAACCADRPRDTDKRAFVLRHRDCNHQFWKQRVTNVTDIYVRNAKEKTITRWAPRLRSDSRHRSGLGRARASSSCSKRQLREKHKRISVDI